MTGTARRACALASSAVLAALALGACGSSSSTSSSTSTSKRILERRRIGQAGQAGGLRRIRGTRSSGRPRLHERDAHSPSTSSTPRAASAASRSSSTIVKTGGTPQGAGHRVPSGVTGLERHGQLHRRGRGPGDQDAQRARQAPCDRGQRQQLGPDAGHEVHVLELLRAGIRHVRDQLRHEEPRREELRAPPLRHRLLLADRGSGQGEVQAGRLHDHRCRERVVDGVRRPADATADEDEGVEPGRRITSRD